KLIGKMVPARVFSSGQRDEKELVGVGDVVIFIAALGVSSDKPAKLLIGSLGVPAIPIYLASDPTGQKMSRIRGQSGIRGALRVVPSAAKVKNLRSRGLEIRTSTVRGNCGIDHGESFIVLALAQPSPTNADSSLGFEVWLVREALVERACFFIIAAEPA